MSKGRRGAWGTGSDGYDPLDNMRSAKVGSRNQTFRRNSRNLIGNDAFGRMTGKNNQPLYTWGLGNRLQQVIGVDVCVANAEGGILGIRPRTAAAGVTIYDEKVAK